MWAWSSVKVRMEIPAPRKKVSHRNTARSPSKSQEMLRQKHLKTRFAKNDREHSRGINDHFGSPLSSYSNSAWSICGPGKSRAPSLPNSMGCLSFTSCLPPRRIACRRSRRAVVTAAVSDSPVSRASWRANLWASGVLMLRDLVPPGKEGSLPW